MIDGELRRARTVSYLVPVDAYYENRTVFFVRTVIECHIVYPPNISATNRLGPIATVRTRLFSQDPIDFAVTMIHRRSHPSAYQNPSHDV